MYDFCRRLVAGLAVTATHASAILAINRDKKREISLAVSSKDRKYRADRMEAQIVADIISKEKTTKQVYFVNEQVDTINMSVCHTRFYRRIEILVQQQKILARDGD